MQWDDLRYFLAVARSRTYNDAAKRLRVDPTTVGRRIDRLVNEFNTQLFETTTNGYQLTTAGMHLLDHAEEVERSTQSITETLKGGRTRLEGKVRLSLSEGFATMFIARHMASFQKANPSIEIEIVITNGFLNLSKREADMAVTLARPGKGPLVAHKLLDYRLGLYVSKEYFSAHPMIDLVSLSSHNLIGYIPDFIYSDELRYLNEISPSLHPKITSSSINVQLALTRSGCGIAILPHFMARDDKDLVAVLTDISITRHFWIVIHEDMAKIARIKAVVDWLTQLAGEFINY
jgi:DNA-binding transcriptional LysR family regulator